MSDVSADSDVPVVIGLGELLWDVFPDSRRPGGAPANVAFQVNQLGCHGRVASRLSDDALGQELRAVLADKQLDLSLVQTDHTYPTGQVTVDLTDEGHPDYVIHEDVAWDHLESTPEWQVAATQASAVCFGTLAQRSPPSREAIHTFLSACVPECLIVYDVNLRQDWYDAEGIDRSLGAASIVKLNREEADILAPFLGIDATRQESFARQLAEKYDLSLVCITRAEEGCLLVTDDETLDLPGTPINVVDAVGAGDAFTAALILSRLQDAPLDTTARFANAVGGLIASRAGGMPSLDDELAALRTTWAF